MSSSDSVFKVGITGGIGCGKSTVLSVFESLGVPTFEADKVAADYYLDPSFVDSVSDQLGRSVRLADGSADKAAIAAIVFADREKLRLLNQLIHPRVHQDFESWCLKQQSKYVLFESAILYESGFDACVDRVVAVYLDYEERVRRLLKRDKVERSAIESRIRNQMSAEQKMMRADWVILNYEGNPRQRQVLDVHQHILSQL